MTEKPEYRQVLKKKVKGEDGEISVDWINNDLITLSKTVWGTTSVMPLIPRRSRTPWAGIPKRNLKMAS